MLDDRTATATAELMTIGYEGASIDDFVATLKAANVTRLIDIRELPLSRKKGFSKRALCNAVEAAGITYEHIKSLGDPKPGRDAAKAGDIPTFKRIFSKHLASEPAQVALDSVISVAIEGGACLLCFERCHKECHRAMVADEIGKRADVSIRHIGVRHGLAGDFD
ncbi:DUF488 domain-containing protein [Ruegeria pomeroyi]|uniref:DUF488 domain-containing protein n=1 Tax=Ruegeria pomeroyi TaxID=89184 RepID=UPI001F1C4455|nr:DUF488 domain-containing protein [Ruegeria pomeroyi]MCE8506885.1 DUF488 domain-containing protein [Ruegeria pomeroyi]